MGANSLDNANLERTLENLKENFPFVRYTSGGNFRVAFEYNKVGYILNTDYSIMTCNLNSKKLSLNEIIDLYETEEGQDIVQENVSVVAEWINLNETMVFYYLSDELCSILFKQFKLLEKILDYSILPESYILNK